MVSIPESIYSLLVNFHTNPSHNPTPTLSSQLGYNVWLGEVWVSSYPDSIHIASVNDSLVPGSGSLWCVPPPPFVSFPRLCCKVTSFPFFSSIRLKDLQARDDAKYANEHAKNLLESHIFNMRDKLSGDEGQLLSTEEEREKIEQALSEASEWLDDEGWDSTADVSL